MPPIVNVADFVKIAAIAYVFIFLVDKGLDKIGASKYGV
jgi:hypothetical protein